MVIMVSPPSVAQPIAVTVPPSFPPNATLAWSGGAAVSGGEAGVVSADDVAGPGALEGVEVSDPCGEHPTNPASNIAHPAARAYPCFTTTEYGSDGAVREIRLPSC
jgi:hypothetical protein